MSGFIPQEIINQVVEQTDIVPLVEQYVKLSKKSSSNYFGLCPFHSETNPSFSVSPNKQIYYCFSCQRGGNAIRFIQDIENVSFPEAVRMLAQRANIEIPNTNSRENQESQSQRRIQQELHLESARFYYRALQSPAGKYPRQYMRQRGYSAKTTTAFGIGFADSEWDSLVNHLTAKGFSEEAMLASGIIRRSSKGNLIDLFRNRIMIPIFPSHGRYIIAFGGRALDDESGPKYINSPETILYHKGKNLFAMNLVRKLRPIPDTLLITEGYMDVIALHQAGYPETVASLGTALTEEQARLMERYAKTVVLAYDSDQAGIDAALRAIDIFSKMNVQVKVLDFGDAKDPDSYLQIKGQERFAALLREAPSALDFQIEIARRESIDSSGQLNLNQYSNRYCSLLAKLESAVMVEIYAKKLAEEIGVSNNTILCDIEQIKKGLDRKSEKQNFYPGDKLAPKDQKVEKQTNSLKPLNKSDQVKYENYAWLMLALLASYPDMYERIKDRFKPQIFKYVDLEDIAKRTQNEIINQEMTVQKLIAWVEDISQVETNFKQKLMPVLLSLDDENMRKDDDLLEDIMGRLESYAANTRQRIILSSLRNKEVSQAEKDNLLQELSQLTKKLN
ncbi:MAG TPA: DNA primase [Candidatus Eisenbacteria bacterium]|nr:DNA primase [Candidatus Eisenbacteria bacterium]